MLPSRSSEHLREQRDNIASALCSCSCLGRTLTCRVPRRRLTCLSSLALCCLVLLCGAQLATFLHSFSLTPGAPRTADAADFIHMHLFSHANPWSENAAQSIHRLNASLHYERSLSEHYASLIEDECIRQLRVLGWSTEQIWNNDFVARITGQAEGDPPLPWTDEKHRDAWLMLGCVNRILYPRALREVQTNYAYLESRIAEKLLEREATRQAMAGLWRMEKGLYSAAHRRKGTCGRELRCVIALSLYGSSPRYTAAIQSSVRRMPRVFPGWELRVYFDHTVPAAILQRLYSHSELAASGRFPELARLDLVNVTTIWSVGSPELNRISGAFYRFLVADDPTVDVWLSRDCDALLLDRDAAAVNEWLASGWSFHTMADMPTHGIMLAGMWGAVNYGRSNGTNMPLVTMVQDAFGGKSMQRLIEDYTLSTLIASPGSDPKVYGCDQEFQFAIIWPVLSRDYMGHDSYACMTTQNTYSFPVQRPVPYTFIGSTQPTGDEGESEWDTGYFTEPRWEDPSKRPAPIECRRKPEWIYG